MYGIDTRALVKILRLKGSMNGIITNDGKSLTDCESLINRMPSMAGLNLAKQVSSKKPFNWNHLSNTEFDQRVNNEFSSTKKLKVVAIDFGIKKSILNRFASYGCEVVVLPFNSDIKDVIRHKPNGIFFSNGPGDPSSVYQGIELAKSLIEIGNIPMFGICLGHQIFGIALGGKTYKLQFGHRGLNHPCGLKNKVEITSQNHGFAIKADSIPKNIAQITHLNLNDNTVAGLKVINKPIFSVQYHPEAGPGPHDSDYLFQRFVSLMLERC